VPNIFSLNKGTLFTLLPSLFLGAILLLGILPQSGDNPLMLAPTILLTIVLILGNKLSRIPTNDPMLLLILLLFLVWGATGLASVTPFPTKVTWVIFATLPLTYLFVRTVPKIDLTLPLCAIGTGLACHALYEYSIGTHRPSSIFDDANLLGLTIALCMAPTLKNKKTWILFPIMLVAMLLTESRTALLALLLGGAGYIAASDKMSLKELLNNYYFIKFLGGLTILSIPLLFFTDFGNRIMHTWDHAQGRLAIWSGSATMLEQHPITGFGLGTFHLNYPPFRLAGDDSLGLMAHMEPLQFAIESGWMAGLLLYALFALAMYRAHTHHKPTEAAILIGLFTAIHITYPLHVVGLMILLAVSLANTSPAPKQEEQKTPILLSSSLLITFLCTTLIALSAGYTFMLWNEATKAARFQDQAKFDAALTACFEQGDPQFPDCHTMAARFLSLSQISDKDKLEFHLQKAEQLNPLNPELPYLRARHMQLSDPNNITTLQPLLMESLSRDPTYWKAREMLIKILMSQDNYREAKKYLDQGKIYPYSGQIRDTIMKLEAQINVRN